MITDFHEALIIQEREAMTKEALKIALEQAKLNFISLESLFENALMKNNSKKIWAGLVANEVNEDVMLLNIEQNKKKKAISFPEKKFQNFQSFQTFKPNNSDNMRQSPERFRTYEKTQDPYIPKSSFFPSRNFNNKDSPHSNYDQFSQPSKYDRSAFKKYQHFYRNNERPLNDYQNNYEFQMNEYNPKEKENRQPLAPKSYGTSRTRAGFFN